MKIVAKLQHPGELRAFDTSRRNRTRFLKRARMVLCVVVALTCMMPGSTGRAENESASRPIEGTSAELARTDYIADAQPEVASSDPSDEGSEGEDAAGENAAGENAPAHEPSSNGERAKDDNALEGDNESKGENPEHEEAVEDDSAVVNSFPDVGVALAAEGRQDVKTLEEFIQAIEDQVPVINVTETLNDGKCSTDGWLGSDDANRDEGHNPVQINYDLEITSDNESQIWYTWFEVKAGGSLTLSGNVYVNGDRGILSQSDPINPVTVGDDGTFNLKDQARLSSDNGRTGSTEGMPVVVEGGGRACLSSSSSHYGSSGCVWVKSGGYCEISAGEYTTENDMDQAFADFGNPGTGHAAIDIEQNGKVDIHGDGVVRIDSVRSQGTLTADNAYFEKVEKDGSYNNNPLLLTLDGGVTWLTGCTFNTQNLDVGGIHSGIVAEEGGGTYVYAPDESNKLSVSNYGDTYYVGAPTVEWSEDVQRYVLSIENYQHTDTRVERRYFLGPNAAFSSLEESQDVIPESLGKDPLADAPLGSTEDITVNPSNIAPYVFGVVEIEADSIKQRGETVIQAGTIHVYGPTSPMDAISVSITWGNMAYDYAAPSRWNPETHEYEGLGGGGFSSPANGERGWVTVSQSVVSLRPLQAELSFEPTSDASSCFAGNVSGSFLFDGGNQAVQLEGTTAYTGLLTLGLTADETVQPFEGEQLVGTAKVTISHTKSQGAPS